MRQGLRVLSELDLRQREIVQRRNVLWRSDQDLPKMFVSGRRVIDAYGSRVQETKNEVRTDRVRVNSARFFEEFGNHLKVP